MSGIGFLMDRACVRKLLWATLFVFFFGIILFWSINTYPTLEKALRKNGSWWAYIFFSINIAIYISVLLSAMVTGGIRIRNKYRNSRLT